MKPSSTDVRTTTVAAFAVAVVFALVASLTVGAPGRATPLRTVTDVEPEIGVTGQGSAEVGKRYKIDVSVEGIPTNRIAGWTVNWGDGTVDRRRGRPGPVGHVYGVAGLSHGITVSVSDGRRTWTTAEVVVPSFDDPERIGRFDADGGDLVADLGPTGGSPLSATAAVVGPDGRLYVAGGASNTIERFDPETDRHVDTFVPAGRGGLDRPQDLAFGPDGHLYVVGSETGQVLRFDGTTGDFLDIFVDGPGSVAGPEATSVEVASDAEAGSLVTPVALGFGPDGYLHVVDRDDDDIERYDTTTGKHLDTFVTFDAGSRPTGLAWGPDGVMFVTLAGAGRVEVVVPVDDGPGMIAGSFGADDLEVPTAVALGPDGTVWVADYWTDRLVRFDPGSGSPVGGGIELDGSFGPSRFTFTDEHRVTVAGEVAGAANEKLDADAWLDRAASAEDVTELRFEANQGKADGDLDFVAGGRDYDTVLTGGDVIVALDGTTTNAIRMDLVGAAADPVIDDDTAAGVTYQDVYTGIDVLYSSNGPELEYSLIVDPGVDPAVVALDFDGATDLDLRDDGSVRFVAASGDGLVMTAPVAYQEFGGTRIPVDSAFDLRPDGTIGFTVGDYDAGLPLIIDPIFKASQSGASGGGNTVTVNRPAGVVSGDVMLASIGQAQDEAVTPPTGWTLIRSDAQGGAVRQDLFYKVATGSEPASYDFTLAQSGDAAGAIAGYSGVDPASPIDAHGGQGNSASSSYVAPSITATGADVTLVGFFASTGGSATAPPAGMTERVDQTSGAASAEIADETLGAPGATGTRTATGSSSLNIGQLVALTPDPGAVTVNSTDDDADASAGDGSCDTGATNSEGDPECTLRAAIEEANASAVVDTLHFDIPTALIGGAHAIAVPASGLPDITAPVAIDATTEPDFVGTPIVELNGAATAGTISGLVLAAGSDGSSIRGLVINRFADDGILGAASGITIAGNYVGTDVGGTLDLGNGGDGIQADGDNWVIGGPTAADRNLISGNTDDGVQLFGDGHSVLGNHVGTTALGNGPIANGDDGVEIASTSTGNTVGGTSIGARNVISGNGGEGVLINVTSGNQVLGNHIGVDATGSVDLGNASNGVTIQAGANGNTIGGTAAGAGNVISENGGYGIDITGSGTDSNTVVGNHIGTDAAGTSDLGNNSDGIAIRNGAANNTIGGTTTADRNIVAGNDNDGIWITDVGSDDNTVQGNWIGVASDGSPLGNSFHGVAIEFNASDNLVGGTAAGAANRIENNGWDGIAVNGGTGTGNALIGNSIVSNTGLGIDIDNDGVTTNDAGDGDTGDNDLLNFPVVTSATESGGTVTVDFDLDVPNGNYRIEFFESTVADPSGNGEGETWISSVDVSVTGGVPTPASHAFAGSPGDILTATATEGTAAPFGSTSEFSANATAFPTSFVVNSTADVVDQSIGDGSCDTGNLVGPDPECTLRAAIQEANASAIDEITLPAGTYTLSIAGADDTAAAGDLDLDSDLTITGAGASTTTINAAGIDRAFHLVSGTATVAGVTVTGGSVTGDGGAFMVEWGLTLNIAQSILVGNNATSDGGAVHNQGFLTLTDSEVSSNGALSGGGIRSNNTATLMRTLFTLNTASLGGGVLNTGDLTVVNSTLTGNTATTQGGGIRNGGDVWLTNVTITANDATAEGGGVFEASGPTKTYPVNSIIAGNTSASGPDASGAIESLGYNIIGDISDSSGWVGTDQQGVDPLLQALADNGGPTQTHALPAASPAIDAGDDTVCVSPDNDTDQRGSVRPVDFEGDATGTFCDIGAYEAAALTSFTVNSNADVVDSNIGDGSCDTGNMVGPDPECTLRAAIQEANASAIDEIALPADDYVFSIPGAGEDSAATGDLDVTNDLTISGAGAESTTIDANSLDRSFEVHGTASLTLSDATLTGGVSTGDGGAVRINSGAAATLTSMVISGNDASAAGLSGGAISNNLGDLTMDRVRVTGNTADNRAALHNLGTATITNSLFDNNTAGNGGAIFTGGAGSSLTMVNVTLSGNSASFGGGLYNNKLATLQNVTITDNTATGAGGGVYRVGGATTNLNNTIIAGNTGPSPDVGGPIDSAGYNVIGDTTGSSGWIGSDQLDVDPLLQALAHNGGPTQTHALPPGSPAIDAGDDTACVGPDNTIDQRGQPRPVDYEEDATGPFCDIGAFEAQVLLDSDGDGLWDVEEDANTDLDSDPATTPGPDTDGDLLPNYLDADDDDDGTLTSAENADPNGDGDPRDARDADRDGQPDYLDEPTTTTEGVVGDEQKISDTTGGLSGGLVDGAEFGRTVESIGDVDGDGVMDLAAGVWSDNDGGPGRGAVYILFMNTDGTVKAEQKISDSSGGLAAALDDGDQFGHGVAGLGDLDGDGTPDLAASALRDDDGGNDHGAIYLLFLNPDGTVKAEQKISDTTGGLTADLDDDDQLGHALGAVGDVDGDGLPDLVAAARQDDDGGTDRGAIYVLFLNADGTVKAEQKISDTAGGLLATLDNDDRLGHSLAAVGDLDGDGLPDLIAGAHLDDDGGTDRGAIYVLFLNADGTVKAEQKISDAAGGLGPSLANDDRFGMNVDGLGDIDGDAVPDVVVGAVGDDDGGSDRGAIYVLLLNADGTVKGAQKTSSTTGVLSPGLTDGDEFGFAVAGVGDLDLDGVPDAAIGTREPDVGGTDRGAVWIALLNSDGTMKSTTQIAHGTGGLVAALADGDGFGASVTGIGDLDGDGTMGLAVGAGGDDDGGSGRGAIYVLNLAGLCADTDGDGLTNCEEDANTDTDNDPSTNPGPDTDGDTTPNYLDADDDGDGTPTASEHADPNGDGDPRDARDSDRDGQPDYLDAPTVGSNGTVADEQKISETAGGLTTTLGVNDHFGRSVAAVGDVDGDGINDIAVGAHWDDDGSSDRGAVYILFLNTDGTVKAEQKISDTAGGFGAVLDNSDEFGIGVAGIGDLDGDLIPDIVVGSHQDDDGAGGNYGAVYVLFLNADGTVKAEQKISDTEGGLSTAFDANDRFGSSVAAIGDLDGDGLNDIVVGAKDDDDGGANKGAVYVLFLNADGTVKAQQKISDTTGGLAGTIAPSGGFGIGVAGPGDIDGDGNNDIAVGTYWDDDGGTNRGAVYVLFLNADGTVKAEQKISDTAGGFNAVLDSNDEFGTAVGALGDVDADGVPDIVVGAPKDDDGNSLSGAAYVLFLNSNGTVKAEQKISNLEGGLGSTLSTSDQFGFGVAGIGDLDVNGTIGLAVGVYGDDDGGPADRGAVYVIDLAGLGTVSVNSTGDGGDANPGDGLCHTGGTNTQGAPECTLRAAIQEANASATIDTIHFAIPQTESGYVPSPQSFNIKVGTLLPAISTPMTIDGSTQTEFATHNRPVIEIDGVDVSAGEENGLWITGGGTVIRSLAINRFGDDAIDIEFAGGNTLVGNHVGIDVAGTVAKPNAWGINIKTGGNVVGGSTAADRNVVSGNTEEGIYLKSGTATANIVRGNHVGTNAAGDAAVPNQSGGVIVFQGASGNQVGGPGAGDGNVIAGNTGHGIEIDGEGSDSQVVEGNHIGVNAAGTAALGNTADAIHVSGGADGVQVLDNLIAHGGGGGVEVVGVSSGLVIQGNTFGTDPARSAVWPGKYASVGLSAGVFDALIGGTGAGDGNVISNAGSDPANPNGISVEPDAGSGISILGNTMTANAGLGIDLDLDGVTANDGGDGDAGPNGRLNFPVLGSVFDDAGDDDVAFDLDVPAGDYRIELFTNRTAGGDASGHGEGEAVVHAETVSHGGSGVEPFVFTVSGLVKDDVVTATATEDLGGGSYGSTSEFSQTITVDGAFTVNSTDDDADAIPGDGDCDTGATNSAGDPECTLRAAIEEGNASTSFATIEFAMPATEAGHSGGLWTVAPGSALPQIIEASSVDATTQPGYGGTPVVRLDGLSAAGATGIRIGALADGSRISGLMVVRFDVDGVLLGIGADGVTISDNWIGSDGTGSAAAGNDDDGIDVNGSNAVIDGNVVNNNQDEGIDVRASGATIVGNIVGLEGDGATGSGNVDVGIAIFADTTTIGGSTPAERNVISMNREGIDVNGSGNVIQGNVIAFNQLKGVDVSGGVDSAVIGNSIHSNGGLGIDLDVDGVATNDGGDGDSGPNDLLNHPEIVNVQRVAGELVVDFRLDVPAGDYRIELFGNTTADASGHGEGETFLGATTVNHGGGGPESFTVTVTSPATILSATATEESSGPVHGSTSEFSPAVPSPDLVIVNATGDAADSAVGDGQCDTGATNSDGDPACTLRAAIAEANDPATPVDTIWFAIPATEPGHSGGVWTISPATGLPSIAATTTIDATTQPGWTASTAAIPAGLDGTQVVVVDGVGTVADGLILAGDDITIRGLVIGGFDGAGVVVTGARAVLQATYVGTGAAGSVANPNTGNGITLAGADAVVGSSDPGDRMVVSGNGGQGIEILGSAGGAAILGSIIGLDAAAGSAVPNGANGIRLSGSTGASVGAPGAGNVIAGNNLAPATADGIYVNGGSGHTIQANLIGTNLADAPLGNFNAGVAVSSATGVVIGGPVAGEGNTIANNGGDGVAITGPTTTVSLLGNAMSDNGGLGIDLDDDGPTPNDSGDGDGGPNGLLNSPALADAEASGSLVVVDYSLDVPAGSYRLEFYSNPGGGDPSGFGEGRTLVGTAPVVHAGAGPESGSAVVTGTIGAVLSATVTQDLGGGSYGPSSEFSAVIVSGSAILPTVADRSVRRSDLRAGGGLDPGGAEVAGLAGRALALDGATERLEGPALDIASAELTMEALIRLDSLVGAPRVVSKRNAASNPIYELFVDGATGEAVASIGVGGATATVRGGAIATATWHHLNASWDGTELILFVDGAEVDRTSASGGLAVDVTSEVTIGADGGGAEALDGLIDDVRVSHRATTASAVAVRHGNVTGPSGLVSVGAQQTASAGAWTVGGVRSRSGGFALQAPETPGPGAAAWAVATGIDEPGMVFESWWWADTDIGVDLSAGTRAGAAPTDQYEAALTSPSGWALRRRVSGAEAVDAPAAGAPSPSAWVKVEIRTDQLGDSRILIDGTEVTGWTAQGAGLGSGSMGLRVGNLPVGREWSIDDARGRKLVTPEPVATLGPLDRN